MTPGATIDIKDNELIVCGNGGKIESSNTDPIIKSSGKYIFFAGSPVLEGGTVVESSSDIVIEEDFKGTLSGNIKLTNSALHLYSASCYINIPEFTANGANSGFFAEVEEMVPSLVAKLGKVVSDRKFPVSSIQRGVVSVGGTEAHIHNFVETKVVGTCMTPARLDRVCDDCGYALSGEILEGEYGDCDASRLVYHEFVSPKDFDFGNIEYWECPDCGKRYTSADSSDLLCDNVLLLPLRYGEAMDLLNNANQAIYVDGNLNEVVISSIIFTSLAIIANLGFSLPSLIKSSATKWAELESKLNMIKKSVDLVSQNLYNVAKDVENIPYRLRIMDRYDNMALLKDITRSTFHKIDSVLAIDGMAGKEDVIRNYLFDWGNNELGSHNASPYDLTYGLMKEYSAIALGLNVPEMYGKYMDSMFLWEHQGYPLRQMVMAQDVSIVGLAYCLTALYNNDVRQYSSETTRTEFEKVLANAFKAYKSAMETNLGTMIQRDTLYRRLVRNFDITYDRTVPDAYGFRGWFENNRDSQFPRNNFNRVAEFYCDKILFDMEIEGRNPMKSEHARFIYDAYNVGRKSSDMVSIYRLLADSAKFISCPAVRDPALLFTYREDGFSHENKDSAIPTYRIFHWESYKGSKNNDYFGVYSCLDDDATKHNRNILFHCNIAIDDGKITNLGPNEKQWNMTTIYESE